MLTLREYFLDLLEVLPKAVDALVLAQYALYKLDLGLSISPTVLGYRASPGR